MYNIIEELRKLISNATLLDLARTPQQIKNLKKFLEKQTKQKVTNSNVSIIEIEQETDHKEVIGTITTYKQPKNPPFYISMKIVDKIAHCCLINGGSRPNVMSKTIMEELSLYCTNDNSRNMLAFNK